MSIPTPTKAVVSEAVLTRYRTAWLWDFLYPDVPQFVQAIFAGELRAVARLVEVNGILTAKKILGDFVVASFHDYKKFIPPVRRREMEILWGILSQMQK